MGLSCSPPLTPGQVGFAILLIGVGFPPVLMAANYIFAHVYPVAVIATLAVVTLGVGSVGNLASSLPTA